MIQKECFSRGVNSKKKRAILQMQHIAGRNHIAEEFIDAQKGELQ